MNYNELQACTQHPQLSKTRLPRTQSETMPDAHRRKDAHGGGVGRAVLAFHDQNLGSKGWLGQFEMLQVYPILIGRNKSPSTCLFSNHPKHWHTSIVINCTESATTLKSNLKLGGLQRLLLSDIKRTIKNRPWEILEIARQTHFQPQMKKHN